MVKSLKRKKQNEYSDLFKLAFTGVAGAVLGGASVLILLGLFSLFFCGIGYYLVVKNNKQNTKPFEDLQKEQYFGAFLFLIGILPWIRYFFISLMLNAGEDFYESNF